MSDFFQCIDCDRYYALDQQDADLNAPTCVHCASTDLGLAGDA